MIILLRKSTIANCRMPKAIGTAVNLKVKLAQSRGAFDPDPMDRWNSNETKPTTKSQQSKRKKERKKKKKKKKFKSNQNKTFGIIKSLDSEITCLENAGPIEQGEESVPAWYIYTAYTYM